MNKKSKIILCVASLGLIGATVVGTYVWTEFVVQDGFIY